MESNLVLKVTQRVTFKRKKTTNQKKRKRNYSKEKSPTHTPSLQKPPLLEADKMAS